LDETVKKLSEQQKHATKKEREDTPSSTFSPQSSHFPHLSPITPASTSFLTEESSQVEILEKEKKALELRIKQLETEREEHLRVLGSQSGRLTIATDVQRATSPTPTFESLFDQIKEEEFAHRDAKESPTSMHADTDHGDNQPLIDPKKSSDSQKEDKQLIEMPAMRKSNSRPGEADIHRLLLFSRQIDYFKERFAEGGRLLQSIVDRQRAKSGSISPENAADLAALEDINKQWQKDFERLSSIPSTPLQSPPTAPDEFVTIPISSPPPQVPRQDFALYGGEMSDEDEYGSQGLSKSYKNLVVHKGGVSTLKEKNCCIIL